MAKRNVEFDFSDAKLRDDIKDFILKMLGAPMVKIELDDQQLTMCIDRTAEFMASSEKVEAWSSAQKKVVLQDGALAHAKMMLGRVRTKYGALVTGTKGVKSKPNSPLGANALFPTDGQVLLSEGERQYNDWFSRVFDA